MVSKYETGLLLTRSWDIRRIKNGTDGSLTVALNALPADRSKLQYGVSVTDTCIDWGTTEQFLREIATTVAPKSRGTEPGRTVGLIENNADKSRRRDENNPSATFYTLFPGIYIVRIIEAFN